MNTNLFNNLRQAQDFMLRLFMEPGSYSTSSSDSYTCSHCGTYMRRRASNYGNTQKYLRMWEKSSNFAAEKQKRLCYSIQTARSI